MEKNIQRILKKLEVKMKSSNSKSNYPKLLALTYLAVAIETIMKNPKNKRMHIFMKIETMRTMNYFLSAS